VFTYIFIITLLYRISLIPLFNTCYDTNLYGCSFEVIDTLEQYIHLPPMIYNMHLIA